MSFSLDRRCGVAYPVQVNRQTIAQLVAGRLHPGDRLPSVRELATDLRISRTTAERIHDSLCDAMLAEVRPRSGTYVTQSGAAHEQGRAWAQEAYAFLKEVVERARRLGLDHGRLVTLIGELYEERTVVDRPPAPFPLIATRDWYECVTCCISDSFPARFVHLSPNVERPTIPPRTRYLLAGYYMHERARKLADRCGCSLIYVRYNARLLDESMDVPEGQHRYFVTRDQDNAEATRAFLANAYPEVPPDRFSVRPLQAWFDSPPLLGASEQVYATVTAAWALRSHIEADRLRLLHPVLTEEFIDELRYLAMFG